MTRKNHDPVGIHAPLGSYTHAVEIGGEMRLLTVSGQVGLRPDGSLAEDIEGQLRQTWANIAAILSAANMTLRDIVKITTIVVRTEDLKVHGRIRAEVLGEHRAAATGFCVTQLATSDMLCEIEVMAAAPRR
ncbi:MAG TPA: RidA family protein [Pseudolabrys sp.]|nr:RidA family protein [Pseudolabrys sp.]